MCGIVAAISKTGGVRAEALGRATACLRHRGPDAQHVWVAADGRAGLGHARLSIIDLETGDQPIANEDGRLRIVVNGEFYDFERIRDDLERGGHVFRTRSDSEIALHLYEESGRARCTRCAASSRWRSGTRATASSSRRETASASNRSTTRRTMRRSIWRPRSRRSRALGVPLRWDRESLYDIQFVAHPPDRTLFDGIYQVPPGCCLLTDGAHIRILPYWDWDYPREDEPDRDVEPREWVERLRHTFEEAVRLRLRADVPVACYLSGGIDSCAVLGVAAQLAPQPLRAFTLSFDDADYDEVQLAEAQAKRSGAEFCRIDVRSQDLADHFAAAVYHAERPFVNAHAVAKYMLSRAVRDAGIKVVLTGEGSDETFAGYPHFRRDQLLYGTDGLQSRGEGQAPRGAGGRQPGVDRHDAAAGVHDARQRASACWDSCRLTSRPGRRSARASMAVARRRVRWPRLPDRDTYRVLLGVSRRRTTARRPRCRQPVAVHLEQDPAAQLRPEQSGRPDGDGPLGRRPAPVPRPPRRRRGDADAGVDEDPRHDREVRAARSGTAVLIDSVYAPAEAPVHDATVDAAAGQTRCTPSCRTPCAAACSTLPGIYDRTKVTALLDALPSMDAAARTRADALLTWMASLCLLGDRMGM